MKDTYVNLHESVLMQCKQNRNNLTIRAILSVLRNVNCNQLTKTYWAWCDCIKNSAWL